MADQSDIHHYLGQGGAGDAILLAASTYTDPKALVIFFANGSSTPFIRELFRAFDIKASVSPNNFWRGNGKKIYNRVTALPSFRQSAHLPDNLNFHDWKNEAKYHPRINAHCPDWKTRFGSFINGQVIIAPSGSLKNARLQRYLSVDEYEAIMNEKLSLGHTVYGIGSEADRAVYYQPRAGHHWLSSRSLTNPDGTVERVPISHMLSCIGGAQEVISVDTWIKTFSLIAGVKTTVIMTRCNGNDVTWGDCPSHHIFLSRSLWPDLRFMSLASSAQITPSCSKITYAY